MGERKFDLVETILGLLRRIEEGRQNAVGQELWRAVDRRDQALHASNESTRIPLSDQEFAPRETEEERARRQSKYDKLNDEEVSPLWKELTAFLRPFLSDVALLSDRLPPNQEWDFYRNSLKQLLPKIGNPRAWPASPVLDTLELRLKQMLSMQGGIQVDALPSDLGKRSNRGPNLELSRERIALQQQLRGELTRLVLEQQQATTLLQLKRKFPDFKLWKLLNDHEQEDLIQQEIKPNPLAIKFVLQHYCLRSEETLKKDRKKLRDFSLPKRNGRSTE